MSQFLFALVTSFQDTHLSIIQGAGRCYWFKTSFGSEAGIIFLDGGSSWCVGGSASNINRVIAKLDFPFKAQVLYDTLHPVK